MSSGFNLSNQYDSVKIFNDAQNKKEENPQATESEGELSIVSPSKQEWLKPILVAVNVVPVCMEIALFQSLYFHKSTSQDKKLLLMLPF